MAWGEEANQEANILPSDLGTNTPPQDSSVATLALPLGINHLELSENEASRQLPGAKEGMAEHSEQGQPSPLAPPLAVLAEAEEEPALAALAPFPVAAKAEAEEEQTAFLPAPEEEQMAFLAAVGAVPLLATPPQQVESSNPNLKP